MTHTSTEQQESEDERALRLVLWLDQLSNCKFGPAAEAARLIETLHARVQELEAQTAHMADLVELADYATKKLEASQARAPLSDELPQGFLSDVLTAAGLVRHGKQCKALGSRIGEAVEAVWKISIQQREAISAHGITQEKQG